VAVTDARGDAVGLLDGLEGRAVADGDVVAAETDAEPVADMETNVLVAEADTKVALGVALPELVAAGDGVSVAGDVGAGEPVGAGVPDAGAVPAGEGDVEPDALPVPLAEPVYETYVFDAVGDARALPVPDAERKVAEGDREREDVAEGDEVPSVADGVGEPVLEGEGEAVAGVPDADVDGVADAEPEGVGTPVRDADAPAETVAADETVAKGDGEDDDVAVDVKAVADGEPEAPAEKVAVSDTKGVVGSGEGDPLDEPDWVKKDVVGEKEGALLTELVGDALAESVDAADDDGDVDAELAAVGEPELEGEGVADAAVAEGLKDAADVIVAVNDTKAEVGCAEGDPLDEPDWLRKDVVGAGEDVLLGEAVGGGGVGEPDAEPVAAVGETEGDAEAVLDADDDTKPAADAIAVDEPLEVVVGVTDDDTDDVADTADDADAEPVAAVAEGLSDAAGVCVAVGEPEPAGDGDAEPDSVGEPELEGEGVVDAAVAEALDDAADVIVAVNDT